jgi:hypothetical protein
MKTHFSSMLAPIGILALALSIQGCDQSKKGDKDDSIQPVSQEPIQAGKSIGDLMQLEAEIRDDGILLTVLGQPAGSTLECHLNEEILTPCHDGALFAFPQPGEYSISATAIKDSKVVAVGDSNNFVIVPSQGAGETQTGDEFPLNLVVDDAAFKDYMAWNLKKDFKVSWKFFKEPNCDAKLLCRYGGRQNPFWVQCDDKGFSFGIKKEDLASGLQELSVQASCGERRGPELTMYWYGVPEDYKPLMITPITDNQERFIFNLVKSNDCPNDDLGFQCSQTTGEDFAACENANVIDNPTPGFRVRASCKGKFGPEVTF